MKLKDYLDIAEIFHPTLFYDGEWMLGGDIDLFNKTDDYVVMNAKKKGKVNLYEKFLEEHFYRPMSQLMNSESIVRAFKPRICFSLDLKGQKRVTLFSLPNFLMQEIASLVLFDYSLEYLLEILNENSSRDELLKEVTKLLQEEKKCFQDIIDNGKISKYYLKALSVYPLYVKAANFNQSFDDFIQAKIMSVEKLIICNKKCLDFFEEEIDNNALLDCFNYDEFCLLIARSVLDICKITEKNKNLVDNSVCVVREYLNAVDKLKKINKNYYCQIVIPGDKPGRKKIVTIEDIRKEYESLLVRHPEFSFIETSQEKIDSLLKYYGFSDDEISKLDFSSKDGEKIFIEFFEKFRADKELLASWVILPKGDAESKSELNNENVEKEIGRVSVDNSEHVRRMLYGRHFLDNSPYAYKLSGTNKFEGYIGYIYPNGVVIFEKFYENEKTGRVAKNSATYVMNIFNFVELSKLSKTEIINSLKNGNLEGVYRIFHRGDMEIWKQEISRAIAGSDYSKKHIDYITSLLEKNTLSKGSVK